MGRPSYFRPSYRLAAFRPNGQPYSSDDGLESTEAVEHRAADVRLAIRSRLGWTPRFRVFYTTRDAEGIAHTSDVTRLTRVNL